MIEITDSQAKYIIENEAIPSEMLQSSETVAVVLTQNWCPQWFAMQRWLPRIAEGIKVYYLCYNKKPYSNEFMHIKERVWKNDLIPYVRYYRQEELIYESNFIDRDNFLSVFEGQEL